MSEHDDMLWDPELDGDPELQRLQALLAPYSVKSRGLGEWMPRRDSARSRLPRLARIAVTGLAACLLLYAGHLYRLAWDEGQPWRVTGQTAGDTTMSSVIAPGNLLETNKQQSLTIAVARIGRINLSPGSRLRLLETRTGKHRVSLESGHLRARIWAPPGYFGLTDGAAEILDLGCDFDVWKHLDGSGRVYVRSGWIDYEVGSHQVLVPAGFAINFSADRPFTPMRPKATREFAMAVQKLEHSMTESGSTSTATLAASRLVAEAAQDGDGFTLLSLLTQYPQLANGDMYPRLAIALKAAGNDQGHRAAWVAGNTHAMNSWWDLYPTQPKNWWVNWTDALY